MILIIDDNFTFENWTRAVDDQKQIKKVFAYPWMDWCATVAATACQVECVKSRGARVWFFEVDSAAIYAYCAEVWYKRFVWVLRCGVHYILIVCWKIQMFK